MDFNLDGILTDYDRVIQVLRDIKLICGNTTLNATLLKHSDLKKYLLEYNKHKLLELEQKLLYNKTSEKNNLEG